MESPPPSYDAIFNFTPTQQQQHLPSTVVVNNAVVVQQAPLVPVPSVPVELINECFCSETPTEVRRIFIRNLFFMFAAEFLLISEIMAILVLVVSYPRNIKEKYSINFCIVMSITLIAIISFWEHVRRIPPANYVTMIIFTICHGTALGCTVVYYREMSPILLVSLGTTCVVCLATAIFELQGRYHLETFRSAFYVWVLNAIYFGISLSFLTINKAALAAGLSTLLCTYLVVNAQMMVHGITHYVLTPKEYVFGAMNIYVDIVHGILTCLAGIVDLCKRSTP